MNMYRSTAITFCIYHFEYNFVYLNAYFVVLMSFSCHDKPCADPPSVIKSFAGSEDPNDGHPTVGCFSFAIRENLLREGEKKRRDEPYRARQTASDVSITQAQRRQVHLSKSKR